MGRKKISEKPQSRHRSWSVTINNPTEEDYAILKDPCFIEDNGIKSVYFGEEIAPSTGTLHLQGYIQFHNDRTLSRVSKMLPRAHLESMIKYSSNECLLAYCEKDKKPILDYGNKPIRQKKEKAQKSEDITKLIMEGKTPRYIAQNFPHHYRYHARGIIELFTTIGSKRRTVKPTVYWYYGPSGCGKTHAAEANTPTFYRKNPHHRWWNKYDYEETIIIDEYEGQYPYDNKEILLLLDKYSYMGEIKYGFVEINSPFIIITSTKHPKEVFSWMTEQEYKQIERRIDYICLFDEPYIEECSSLAPPPKFGKIQKK